MVKVNLDLVLLAERGLKKVKEEAEKTESSVKMLQIFSLEKESYDHKHVSVVAKLINKDEFEKEVSFRE